MAWNAPSFDGSGSLRGCADEAHWAAAARETARRHGLSCDEPRLFPTGSDVVVDCGGHVVKMTAPRWAEEIATERDLLARVAGRLSVVTPEPIASGELDGWPYVLTSRVPGRALADVWPTLGRAERRRLARGIGELAAEIQAVPVTAEEAADWPPFLDRMRDGAAERLAATGADEAWCERVGPFLDSLDPISDRPPALLHTELYDQHLLVEERGGRWELTAVLDFADGRAGHPFYEVPASVEFFLRGERPLLRDLLLGMGLGPAELGPDLARELCGFSLLHQFCHWGRLLRAVGKPEPHDFDEIAERLHAVA